MNRLPQAAFAGCALLAAAAAAPVARAQNIVNYGVTLTATSPVFNRPNSTTTLSGVGTAVFYQAQRFTVNTTGAYSLQTTAASLTPGTATDTVLAFYQNGFNSAAPLTNLIGYGDDDTTNTTSTSLSLISQTLTAGVPYTLVTTTFNNATTGTINSRITGPAGSVVTLVAVPEPGSLALMGASLLPLVGGIAARRRRRAA